MANYSAEIVSTALGESKEKHTPFVAVQVKTIKCLDTDEETERKFTATLWLSDNAVERTVKTLRDLGFSGQTLVDLNYPDCMLGLLCEVSTAMEEYNGKTEEKAKFLNKPGSFANRGLRACSEDMAKTISQRFDAVLRTGKFHKPAQQNAAYGRAQARPAAPQQAHQWGDGDGDYVDLPF